MRSEEQAMAGKVFISHAAEDTGRCAPLVRAFTAWGVDHHFAAHADQESAAGQQLSRQEQEALAMSSILLRICTRSTPRSYWMSLETGAFLGLQADERRAGHDTRRIVNLILDPTYTREPFDRTTTLVDAQDGKNAPWVEELRAALGLPPLAAPSSLSGELFPPTTGISRRAALGIAAATVAVVAAASAGGAFWLARPQHTVTSGPAPTPTPPVRDSRLRWARRVKAPDVFGSSTGISAAPLVANGLIYVGSQDGNFAAFDSSGAVKWGKTGYTGGIWRQAAATAGLVVFASDTDDLTKGLVACDASTGAILWGGGPAFDFTELVASGGVLYVSAYKFGGFVDTLNLTDGTAVVSFHPSDNSAIPISPPLITASIIYIMADNGYLYALDAHQPGPERWRADVGATKSRLAGTKIYSITRPALDPTLGVVYAGSDDTNIYAVDAQTGAERWRYATGNEVRSYPVVDRGAVFIGSSDQSVYALDGATGALKWRYQTGGAVVSPPTVANGTVYIGSRDGTVYALDSSTGAVVTKFQTAGPVVSQPVLTEGTLYLTSLDGYLYAYQL